MTSPLLAIPCSVTSCTDTTLTLTPTDTAAGCEQCAKGQGCGQNPWFRGFLGQKPLTIPRPADFPNHAQSAELCLPAGILSRLTVITYALPLLAFLFALAVCANLAPWLAFCAAIATAAGGFTLGHKACRRLLEKHLILRPFP